MSIVKSSCLNLYDAVSGDHHFQTKVSSDKVDMYVSSLPITIKGTKVHITNEGGDTVQDLVQTTKDIQQSVVDETNARISAVSAEATLRTDGNAVLQNAINQEAVDRAAAIQAESLIRVAAEDALDVKITEEKSARQAAITAEISARSAADTVLQTNLDAEAKTRGDNDATLQSNIDVEASARQAADQAELNARAAADAVLQSNLDTEESERKTADATLQANIDQEVLDRQTAVDDENTARVAGDTTLQSNLDAEAKSRADADVVLQQNIDTETANRITAVSDEATARADADNQLSVQITAEQTARLAEVDVERKRIDSILEGTSIDLNQLQELVTAYTTSDNNILAQIAAINTNITNVQSQLDGTNATLNTLIANIEATQAPVILAPLLNDSFTDTLDGAVQRHWNGGYTITYETVFSLGALTGTASDVLYFKGLRSDGATAYHAVYYSTNNSRWQMGAQYDNFFTDPVWNPLNIVHLFGTDGIPDTHVYHIWQTGTPKEIIDDAVQKHWNGAYTFTYESIFTIGALTNTPSDTFYFKGVRNDGGTYYHAVNYSTGRSQWQMVAQYDNFNSDPTWNPLNVVHLFGTDGQPSGIVYHSTTV